MQKPTGVILIGILYIIGAILSFLAGVAAFFFGGALMMHAAAYGMPVTGMAGGFGAFLGVMLLVFGALSLIIAIGLFGLKNWARVVAMILSAIGAVFGLLAVFALMVHFAIIMAFWQMIKIAINVLIAWYLNQAEVKRAFGA
jgi:hypothetical protein